MGVPSQPAAGMGQHILLQLTSALLFTTLMVNSLKCYNCSNCPHVDDSTPVVEGAVSCEYSVDSYAPNGAVMRRGTNDEHADGECVGFMGLTGCWCTHDLCNNKSFGYIED